MKQALAAIGFKGGTRSDTEWKQWVAAEKEQLAAVMQRHDIEGEKKGTHEKHLSVLDFRSKSGKSLPIWVPVIESLNKIIREKEAEYQGII